MESFANYVSRAEACARNASSVDAGDELSAYWQREAQIEATLAVAIALHELRNMLARGNEPDAGAFIRVAGEVVTHDGDVA